MGKPTLKYRKIWVKKNFRNFKKIDKILFNYLLLFGNFSATLKFRNIGISKTYHEQVFCKIDFSYT